MNTTFFYETVIECRVAYSVEAHHKYEKLRGKGAIFQGLIMRDQVRYDLCHKKAKVQNVSSYNKCLCISIPMALLLLHVLNSMLKLEANTQCLKLQCIQ